MSPAPATIFTTNTLFITYNHRAPKTLNHPRPSLFVTIATAVHNHSKNLNSIITVITFFTQLPCPHSYCFLKPSRTITVPSQYLPHCRSYHSQWQASTSQIPLHNYTRHTVIIMVFKAMTTNAPTMIPSPTTTKFPSNRRERESIRNSAYHSLTTALTTVLKHTVKYTVMYTQGYICIYNHQIHLWLRNFVKRIVIELWDASKVTVSHHGLVNVSQKYEVDPLYTPTFRVSLPSINPLDTAGYTCTFGHNQCSISSPSINITGNQVNNLYHISCNCTHFGSTKIVYEVHIKQTHEK